MRFAECRFPLVHVLDTKSAFLQLACPSTPLVLISAYQRVVAAFVFHRAFTAAM